MTTHFTPGNPAHGRFKTGMRPTPAHKVARAVAEGRLKVHATGAAPTQAAMIPRQLGMWLNDVDGDCVTAEEAFAIAAYSTHLGLPEVFIPDSSVLGFCNKFGVLNGADLLSVIQDMESTGLLGSDGKAYKDGVPSVVDFANEQGLQSAIATGPVKIGIMSSALPNDAGSHNGWSIFNPGPNGRENHCVSLCGYGPVDWLAQQLGVAVPPGAPAVSYLLFTWSTIGFISWSWLQAACSEAYLRTPTTLGLSPSPVPTPPPPTPTPSNNAVFHLTWGHDVPKGGLVVIPPFLAPAAIAGRVRYGVFPDPLASPYDAVVED